MTKDFYHSYITSSKWFQVRNKVFKLQGKQCKKCESKKKLHVHHKTYERLGNESIETDLVVLCKKCHDTYHTIHKHTSIETTDCFILDKKLKTISNTKKKVLLCKEKKKKKLSKKEMKKAIQFVASVKNKRVSKLELHSPLKSTIKELLSVDKGIVSF